MFVLFVQVIVRFSVCQSRMVIMSVMSRLFPTICHTLIRGWRGMVGRGRLRARRLGIRNRKVPPLSCSWTTCTCFVCECVLAYKKGPDGVLVCPFVPNLSPRATFASVPIRMYILLYICVIVHVCTMPDQNKDKVPEQTNKRRYQNKRGKVSNQTRKEIQINRDRCRTTRNCLQTNKEKFQNTHGKVSE